MILLSTWQILCFAFLAGPKGQLFKLHFPSLTHSLTKAEIVKSYDAIVITRERSVVGIKVRKQGPSKIEF